MKRRRHTSGSGSGRSPGETRARLAVTRSTGATGDSNARASCAPSSDRTSWRPRSSAPASGRSRCGPSSGDDAGSAPRKHGVDATTAPSTMVWLTETWWPPNRQAQRTVGIGLTEDPHEVHAGIAATVALERGGPALELVEHVLEADDRRGRDVPGPRQPAAEQSHGQALLRRSPSPRAAGRRGRSACSTSDGARRRRGTATPLERAGRRPATPAAPSPRRSCGGRHRGGPASSTRSTSYFRNRCAPGSRACRRRGWRRGA